jgi:hypothetical protein
VSYASLISRIPFLNHRLSLLHLPPPPSASLHEWYTSFVHSRTYLSPRTGRKLSEARTT